MASARRYRLEVGPPRGLVFYSVSLLWSLLRAAHAFPGQRIGAVDDRVQALLRIGLGPGVQRVEVDVDQVVRQRLGGQIGAQLAACLGGAYQLSSNRNNSPALAETGRAY